MRLCLERCAQAWSPVFKKNELMQEQLQRILPGGSGSWSSEMELEDWPCSALQNELWGRVRSLSVVCQESRPKKG